MSIFQLDFPFLLLSISQNWNSAFTIAFFGLDFPFVFSSPSGARGTSGWLSEFWLRLIKADDDYDDFSIQRIQSAE